MHTLLDISQLLKYENQHILTRYEKDYPSNQLSAREALAELLKYFWLCEKHRHDIDKHANNESLKFICAMHPEMKEIDDMWHTFLLFTREYLEFCQHHFGHFLHHEPRTDDDESSIEDFTVEITRYLSYAYDNLGEETVKKWFSECLTEASAD